jgi:hypothetical protein
MRMSAESRNKRRGRKETRRKRLPDAARMEHAGPTHRRDRPRTPLFPWTRKCQVWTQSKVSGRFPAVIFRFLQYIFACKHKKMPVIERKPECFAPERLPRQTAKVAEVAEVEEFPRRGWRSEFTLALPQTDSRAHEPSAGALVWWDHLQYSGASAR